MRLIIVVIIINIVYPLRGSTASEHFVCSLKHNMCEAGQKSTSLTVVVDHEIVGIGPSPVELDLNDVAG